MPMIYQSVRNRSRAWSHYLCNDLSNLVAIKFSFLDRMLKLRIFLHKAFVLPGGQRRNDRNRDILMGTPLEDDLRRETSAKVTCHRKAKACQALEKRRFARRLVADYYQLDWVRSDMLLKLFKGAVPEVVRHCRLFRVLVVYR